MVISTNYAPNHFVKNNLEFLYLKINLSILRGTYAPSS
jgi:hypothetical protein